MLRFSIILSLISTFNLYSQNSIQFTILNEEKKPISFASAYCTSTKTGGYSNQNGKITLSNINKEDSLLLKCLGYEEKLIIVSEVSDTMILKRKTTELKEFTIKSAYKRETYGITRKTFFKTRLRGGYVGYREGIVMDINEKSQLESVQLYIENIEDSSRTKFLLMIYSVSDSTDLPLASILTENIFFDVSKKGWSKINLDSLGIFIRGKIFIGVESVPNFDFKDAPSNFSFTDKPYAQYKSISYFFKAKSLLWAHGYVGNNYIIGFDSDKSGANNNFPMIKATFKK